MVTWILPHGVICCQYEWMSAIIDLKSKKHLYIRWLFLFQNSLKVTVNLTVLCDKAAGAGSGQPIVSKRLPHLPPLLLPPADSGGNSQGTATSQKSVRSSSSHTSVAEAEKQQILSSTDRLVQILVTFSKTRLSSPSHSILHCSVLTALLGQRARRRRPVPAMISKM